MKRRVCSMMLALALCLGILPGMALAEEALPDNAEDTAGLETPWEEEAGSTTAVSPDMEDTAEVETLQEEELDLASSVSPETGSAEGVPATLAALSGWEEDEDGNVTISTAEALVWLSAQVNGQNGEANNYHGKVITLAADIDLSGMDWTPIGSSGTTPFKGSFDGGGHTVSNMTFRLRAKGICLVSLAM